MTLDAISTSWKANEYELNFEVELMKQWTGQEIKQLRKKVTLPKRIWGAYRRYCPICNLLRKGGENTGGAATAVAGLFSTGKNKKERRIIHGKRYLQAWECLLDTIRWT